MHKSPLELIVLSLLGLMGSTMLMSTFVSATTVTYKMAPHERACFYTEAKTKGEKVAFYFAVQSGGQFDIDFEVIDPRQVVLLKGSAERQGDYVFSAREPGEFTVCFSNTMSTFSDKTIDFDVTSEHELPGFGTKSKLAEALGPIDSLKKDNVTISIRESVEKLEVRSNTLLKTINWISRNQREMRTSEHRNLAIVHKIGSRIFWFAIGSSCVMVSMSIAQVFAIQTFFSKGGRTRV
ncbi:hypothetical protein BDV3_001721 [Batrachochytrium dendrobatidis]